MPEQIWLLLQCCLEADPNKRPTFSAIIQFLGQCLIDKNILSREMTKFTSQTSSSGNTSSETVMRPPGDTNSSYLTPLIPPGNKFEFINRPTQRTERNKSIVTIDTVNSPGTGTCSTVTTMVYGSNQSNDGNSTYALNSQHNIQSNGLDGSISPTPNSGNLANNRSQSVDSRKRRDSRLSKSIPECDEETQRKLEERQKLNQQLNEQYHEQLTERLNEKYRPFIKKIRVGTNLNKLSEIFRNKDPKDQNKDGIRKNQMTKCKQTIKQNLFNKNKIAKNYKQAKLKDQLSNKKLTNQVSPSRSANRIGGSNQLANSSPTSQTTSQANQPTNTSNTNELILNPSTIV